LVTNLHMEDYTIQKSKNLTEIQIDEDIYFQIPEQLLILNL
jgi:hypothetical protein